LEKTSLPSCVESVSQLVREEARILLVELIGKSEQAVLIEERAHAEKQIDEFFVDAPQLFRVQ